MTANLFAALLDGVPRMTCNFDTSDGSVIPPITLLHEDAALAALAAAYPADLAEAGKVVDDLRHTVPLSMPYRCEIADLITALLARIAAQEAQIKGLEADRDRRTEMHECAMSERDDATLYADEQKARAEAAETALAAMTKERDELATANHRQASCIHVTAANLGPDCSATVDGLPKAARHVAAERDALLGAVKGLVEVLDQHETKGPLPDTALMFCWLAAQNVRAVLRGYMLEKPE